MRRERKPMLSSHSERWSGGGEEVTESRVSGSGRAGAELTDGGAAGILT